MTSNLQVIGGLAAGDLRLSVNGKPVSICAVSTAGRPVSIGIVLDISKSMGSGQLDRSALARAGVERLLAQARPQDEFLLVYAATDAAVAVPLTQELSRIGAGLNVRPAGGSAVLDGIHQAIAALRTARHVTRAVVGFTDGEDNNSARGPREIEAAARSAGASVFVVTQRVFAARRTASEPDDGRDRVAGLARGSGGFVIEAGSATEGARLVAELSAAIHSPYLVSFAYPRGNSELKVKVEFSDKRRRGLLAYRPTLQAVE
jgi:hypothetical protein